MECKGCGAKLQKLEYQARSADEAHDVVHKCPRCPLEIDKFSNSLVQSHTHLIRQSRSKKRIQEVDSSNSYCARLVSVTTKNRQIWDHLPVSKAYASNFIDSSSKLYKGYNSGPWSKKLVSTLWKRSIGPSMSLTSVSILHKETKNDMVYCDFEYVQIDADFAVLHRDFATICRVFYDENLTGLEEWILSLYVMGANPTSLTGFVNNSTLGAMSNISARAYDASFAKDYEYKFSTKPDGERMWMTRIGIIWVFSRRLINHTIEGWIVDMSMLNTEYTTIGPVIDIEVLLNHSPILIDILLDHTGSISPHNRNVEWVNIRFDRLRKQFKVLGHIQTRNFYDTMKESEIYRDNITYPTDGLVAISKSGTDMLKLKQLKSIELQLDGTQYLVTKEGTKLFKLGSEHVYTHGDILELRISVQSNTIKVHDIFIRPDKNTANSDSVIESILSLCVQHKSKNILRTSIWRWSNNLRLAVYERAFVMADKKNIILDIGSGTGQSTDAFTRTPRTSYILVEPDKDRCIALAKRLNVRTINTDPRSIIPAIQHLKRGTKRYHILNTSLQTILGDSVVCKNISGIVGCIVASFSIHFIENCLQQVIKLRIPLIGSYYSYDDIPIGSSIINDSGLLMTKLSDTEAVVKWGSDDSYYEPVFSSSSLPFGISVLSASEFIDLPTVNESTSLYMACSHVKVLIYR